MLEVADRFDGLAETYALHRPGYPTEAFDHLFQQTATDKRIAVDVGAGPGNSTAALRAALPAGWLITAVEPGHEMRRVLTRSFSDAPCVQVVNGLAEAVPLPDGSAGLMAACTAFHWFDRPAFYAEAARVLAPGGVLALVRNRRVPCAVIDALNAYIAEHAIEVSDHARREASKEPSVRELSEVTGFSTARSRTYAWREDRDRRGLIDLYLTRSSVWSIVRRTGLRRVMDDLQAVCAATMGETVTLDWETTVKWARRR